jgi:hypothetical protein
MNHHGNVAWYWYLLLALPFLLYGAVGVILAFNVNPKVSIFGYILIADLPLYFYALGYLPNTFGYLDATLRRIFNYLGLTLCLGLVFLFYFGPGGYQSFLAYEAEEGVKNFFILYARPNGALWGSLLSLITLSGYIKSRDDGELLPAVLLFATIILMPAVGMYIGITLALIIVPIWILRFVRRNEIASDKAKAEHSEETDEYGSFKNTPKKGKGDLFIPWISLYR